MSFKRKHILKTDIINYLGQTRNYRSYLEICTPTTGWRYSEINRSTFELCHRLMYRCPDTFRDGWKIDFRSETLDIAEPVTTIHAQNFSYDVILVDPWHEYETSYRDLAIAASLISARGTIVVHDCLPPTETIAGPQFSPGSWCGVTYKAFLDFVFSRSDLSYFTVNADYGCGIIRKNRDLDRGLTIQSTGSDIRDLLVRRWRSLSDRRDLKSIYGFFEKNSESLLNLVSVDTFKRSEERRFAAAADGRKNRHQARAS
ncbi:MAG: hypothetical protein ACLQUZ_07340 [Rhizomicrobium sp.]